MKSAEDMRYVTQHAEQSSQEQTKGGQQVSTAIESMADAVKDLRRAQRQQEGGVAQGLEAISRLKDLTHQVSQGTRDVASTLGQLDSIGERSTL